MYSKLVKAGDLTRRTHSGTSIGRPAWSVWHCPVRSRNATCTLPPLLPPAFLSVEVEVFGRVVSEVTNPTRNSPLNLSLAFSGPSSPRSSPARHFSLLFSPFSPLPCFPYFVNAPLFVAVFGMIARSGVSSFGYGHEWVWGIFMLVFTIFYPSSGNLTGRKWIIWIIVDIIEDLVSVVTFEGEIWSKSFHVLFFSQKK